MSKIVVCENCHNIPRITILNENKVQIECQKCNTSEIKDFSYLNKYMKPSKEDILFTMPRCNYNKDHEETSIIYCFQCSKYLCEKCNELHNSINQGKKHYNINQKIENQYYCSIKGHQEYILDSYCIKCKVYLCSQCKINHNRNNHKIYEFNEKNIKISEVKESIKKIINIISDEENNLKQFTKKLIKLILELKDEFKKYKKRNMDIISIYELLIDNYEKLNLVRNYNINNNIVINNNFNFDTCKIFDNECFCSKFNRLYSFYRNQNHILTQNYKNYFITEKFCENKIIKCVAINKRNFILIFKDNTNIHHYIYLNKENKYELATVTSEFILKDVIPLNGNKFLRLVKPNNLQICTQKQDGINISYNAIADVDFVIVDKFNNNNFFAIINNDEIFVLNYYENGENKKRLIYEYKKYNIKYIFEDINDLINNDKSLEQGDKEKLKKIFLYNGQNDENIDKLIKEDKNFRKFLFEKNKNFFNEIKNNFKESLKEYIDDKLHINSNINYINIFQCLKSSNKISKEVKEKISYILKFNLICENIVKIYKNYLVFNTKINHVYNYGNRFIIFMGDNYLLDLFSIKEKNFRPYLIDDHIKDKYNDFDIKYIYEGKYIIFDDFSEKNIYIMKSSELSFFKKTYKYNSNFVAFNNYLLFDNIKDSKIELTLIDLSEFSIKQNFYLNIGIIPQKLLLWQNYNKIINLYEDNQIYLVENVIKNESNSYNIDNNKNNQIQKLNVKLEYGDTISKAEIFSYSSAYDAKYYPANLFIEGSYYCSKSVKNEYITFYFKKEYLFSGFEIKLYSDYKKARPKNLKVSVFDEKKRIIDERTYFNNNIDVDIIKIQSLNIKGAYLRLDFLDNFGEKFICFEGIKFFVYANYCLE